MSEDGPDGGRSEEWIREKLLAIQREMDARPPVDATRPPWIVHPEIPAGSIGWRMGGGEGYLDLFVPWFRGLLDDERARFIAANPEPPGWTGYYRSLERS